MVAKSYQKLKILSDQPYIKPNGKMYVKVLMKGGSDREVRWYTSDEYSKMYPGESVEPEWFGNQKNSLGFQEGYITIFKGNQEEHEDWFNRSIARYCRHWGWYVVSEDTIPFDLPANLEPIELKWEMVGNGNALKKEEDRLSRERLEALQDANGNHYAWDTGAKFWAEGSIKTIRGSVKEHKIINNIQTTVLTRCLEQMK